MKLYEIAAEYQASVAKLMDLNLPPETVADTIEEMQGDIKDKVRAVVAASLQMDAQAEIREGHAKRMLESAKAEKDRAESLRTYAQITIQNCGIALPLKFPEFDVSLQRNPPSCEVTDVAALEDKLKKTTLSWTVFGDGQWLAKAVGAAVAENKDMQWSLDAFNAETKPVKRDVLSRLKDVERENEELPEGQEPKRLAGARLNPPSYRMTIK